MRRLPADKFAALNFPVEDSPENCSTLFLLRRSSSIIQVDNPLNPKLVVVTYPSLFPSMRFFFGKADRVVLIQRLLRDIQSPADLVIPTSMLPLVSNYWPIRFSIPVFFLAARPEQWRPLPSNDSRVRLLTAEDVSGLRKAFAEEHAWLWEFFFTPENLIKEGQAIAAFVDGEIACVATTLAFTERYCEIGVVTRPKFRGMGLALECCRSLSYLQYHQYDRLTCWRTDFGNVASRKVASKLGLNELKSGEKYLFISNYQHVGAYATVAP